MLCIEHIEGDTKSIHIYWMEARCAFLRVYTRQKKKKGIFILTRCERIKPNIFKYF